MAVRYEDGYPKVCHRLPGPRSAVRERRALLRVQDARTTASTGSLVVSEESATIESKFFVFLNARLLARVCAFENSLELSSEETCLHPRLRRALVRKLSREAAHSFKIQRWPVRRDALEALLDPASITPWDLVEGQFASRL